MCLNASRKLPPTPSPYHYDASLEIRPPLAPSSAYATRYRIHPNLRVCQLVKVFPREGVTLVCRRWPLATPASGFTDPHVRGIAPFPEPGDFTASSAPCQGPVPRTEVPLPETRIFPSRSACRREKRTLTCLSGTQRVLHIDITMSSAWSVAFPLRVAAARWPRRQLNEYTTCQTLCQVVSLASSSHARSLLLPAPAGLTRRLNCALRGCEL
jgi:hypothetical protein